MDEVLERNKGEDPLKFCRQFMDSLQCLIAGYDKLTQRLQQSSERICELEQENEQLRNEQQKNSEWSSRVTYEGVVEQIAACEDAKERDEARKLIEPLLSKAMATKFRRDIRLRVKELNEGGGANITIEHVAGDFNVNKAVRQIGN